MDALAQHLRMRLKDDRVIAPTAAERRVVARVVLDQGRAAGLLAFGLADTHLHALATGTRAAAAQLARRVAISLGRRLELRVGFTPAHVEEIRDNRHLLNAFRYDLRQQRRHGLDWDPLAEASNLPDLLGLRLIGGYTATNVRRVLPRLQRGELLELLGVPALEPRAGPLERLAEATLAAACLPGLGTSSADTLEARRAMAEVSGRRLAPDELAAQLGVCRRSVFYLRAGRSDPRLVQAIRLQLGLIVQRENDRAEESRPFVAATGTS